MTWSDGEYRPKQKRANAMKDRILDSAFEQISTVGYHHTTAKAVAAGAGVAVGSFYRYFKDKKAVLMSLCRRMEDSMGGDMFGYGARMRAEGAPERDVAPALVGYAVARHYESRAFHREVSAMERLDPDVAAWSAARDDRIRTALQAFLEEKRDAYRVRDLEAAAELMLYVVEEVAHRAVIFESRAGETRLVSELGDMLERYLFP